MGKHARAAVTLVSGYVADPVRQYYDYAAQATDAFDRCISSLRRERVETLLRGEERVCAVTALPPEASAVRGGWKKLHAIANASSAAASHPDALVVWHDADAVPDVESGLVERVRRIAALQPGVAVWLLQKCPRRFPPGVFTLTLWFSDGFQWRQVGPHNQIFGSLTVLK